MSGKRESNEQKARGLNRGNSIMAQQVTRYKTNTETAIKNVMSPQKVLLIKGKMPNF